MTRILLIVIALGLLSCSSESEQFVESHDMPLEEGKNVVLFFNVSESGDVTLGNDLTYINIHCTGDTGNRPADYYLNFWATDRGWTYPGYNFLVHEDGAVDTLLPIDFDCFVEPGEVSNGVYGVNSKSINIAYTGGAIAVGRKLYAYDTRTDAQVRTIQALVDTLTSICPNVQIMGHRDHPNVSKQCPSFRVSEEFYRCN